MSKQQSQDPHRFPDWSSHTSPAPRTPFTILRLDRTLTTHWLRSPRTGLGALPHQADAPGIRMCLEHRYAPKKRASSPCNEGIEPWRANELRGAINYSPQAAGEPLQWFPRLPLSASTLRSPGDLAGRLGILLGPTDTRNFWRPDAVSTLWAFRSRSGVSGVFTSICRTANTRTPASCVVYPSG